MKRGIFEVTEVGGNVSIIGRTSFGIVAFKMTVSPWAYGQWMNDALREMLDRVDPVHPRQTDKFGQFMSRKIAESEDTDPDVHGAIEELLPGDEWKRGTIYDPRGPQP